MLPLVVLLMRILGSSRLGQSNRVDATTYYIEVYCQLSTSRDLLSALHHIDDLFEAAAHKGILELQDNLAQPQTAPFISAIFNSPLFHVLCLFAVTLSLEQSLTNFQPAILPPPGEPYEILRVRLGEIVAPVLPRCRFLEALPIWALTLCVRSLPGNHPSDPPNSLADPQAGRSNDNDEEDADPEGRSNRYASAAVATLQLCWNFSLDNMQLDLLTFDTTM